MFVGQEQIIDRLKGLIMEHSLLDEATGCWVWQRRVRPKSRPKMVLGIGRVAVARIAYMCWVGVLVDDEEVAHLCNNPMCVNPDHLQAMRPRVHRRWDREHGAYTKGRR